MRCPVCNILLMTADRQGVEVDYCPKCWGVWLDRGELNLILERSDEKAESEDMPALSARPHPQTSGRAPLVDAPVGPGTEFSWKRFVESR